MKRLALEFKDSKIPIFTNRNQLLVKKMQVTRFSQSIRYPVDFEVADGFTLPTHLFVKAFPFHLVFNSNKEILQLGEAWHKISPDLSVGSQIDCYFKINRPNIQFEFDLIREQYRSLFLLELLPSGMQLKGQMLYVKHLEVMIFLCSPWVTDIASLKSCGLTLNHFPIHDPVVDFLFLLQAQNTALNDAKKLTDKLTQQQVELRQINRQLTAQYAVTHILAESLTFSEAATKLLEAIGTALDWQMGVLWTVDKHSNLLRCQEVWKRLPDLFPEFALITQTLTFPPGMGLPGHVWQRGKSVWIPDISEDRNSPRRLHAIEAGIHGAFGLPIKSGGEIIGILEFFSQKVCQSEEGLLEMMADIGIKIGQFVQRKRMEEALLKQTEISESLKSILDNMGDAVIVADENHNFLVCNPAAERMFGNRAVNLVSNQSPQLFGLYLADKVTPFPANELPLSRSIRGEDVNDVEMFVRHPKAEDGFWVIVTGRPLKDKNGNLKGGVIVCRDITERKQVEQQLLHDAFHDRLTGLANRAWFMERLEFAIALSKRREDYVFAVLFLDLDRFKVINDSLGHIVGDQLLIAISRRLETCLRSVDTIARLGGDEFAILLEFIHSNNDAIYIAERIQKELMHPFNINGHEIFANTSIGIAISSTDYHHPEEMLRDADTAMYHAKAQGKGCYQLFDKAMHVRVMELLQLENDLRRAIERQEFQLHYQPIVSLRTGRIAGFEALVRWQHSERGFVSPTEFISVAEDTGIIIPLGYWVLQEACRQMREWHLKFPLNKPLIISVNISGKQFSQTHLPQQIEQILQETGLDPQSLKLEITESVLMENSESELTKIRQLLNLGIQLSMDDFGTGYSSLSYLHKLPINTLKIDRSFISCVEVDIEKLVILQSVVRLAWNLGMDVVAEGVETIQQLSQLKALSCEFGQGYLFSAPVDSNAATDLILREFPT